MSSSSLVSAGLCAWFVVAIGVAACGSESPDNQAGGSLSTTAYGGTGAASGTGALAQSGRVAAVGGAPSAGRGNTPAAMGRAGGPAVGAPSAGSVAGVPSAGGAAIGASAGGSGVAGAAARAGVSAGASGQSGATGAAGQAGGVAVAGSGTPSAGGAAAHGGEATPSAGCASSTGVPAGGKVMQSDRIYDFPASYDGKTPMPLLLALHAAGNPNTQLENLTRGSALETSFVRVFPKSAGSAWVYSTDSAKVKAVLDDVLTHYCIDTSRMFATGHSSGAQMVVQMLCNGETRFKAVAPVAASKYCNKVSSVAVMYIQGMMDAQRGGGNGMDVVSFFTASNACSTSTTPKTDVASCMSTFDHMQVTPGCVTFGGCMAPTVWCSHNDNGYNSTDGRQHGWPCFASSAIADFFMSLP